MQPVIVVLLTQTYLSYLSGGSSQSSFGSSLDQNAIVERETDGWMSAEWDCGEMESDGEEKAT